MNKSNAHAYVSRVLWELLGDINDYLPEDRDWRVFLITPTHKTLKYAYNKCNSAFEKIKGYEGAGSVVMVELESELGTFNRILQDRSCDIQMSLCTFRGIVNRFRILHDMAQKLSNGIQPMSYQDYWWKWFS